MGGFFVGFLFGWVCVGVCLVGGGDRFCAFFVVLLETGIGAGNALDALYKALKL